MAAPLALVGSLNSSLPQFAWIVERVATEAVKVLTKPEVVSRTISRLGDLVVWKSEGGTQVVAAIETLGETQHRIESAISGIESAQFAMSSTLGTVQALSMATFGVTSFSAGFMVWRLHALNKRLDRLSRQVADVEARLDARDRALLDGSLNFLHEYERKNRDSDLDQALGKARDSAGTYGRLVGDESEGQKRLSVLNYYGRCYLLSLMTELRCMVLREDAQEAVERVEKEKPRLQLLVDTTYRETLANAPELFLDSSLASSGVTLELMTDLYQQLQHAGVLKDVEIRDGCDLFEHLRARIFDHKTTLWRPFRRAKSDCLKRLRYLISCVEDCNRIQSMGLLIEKAKGLDFSLADISEQVQEWKRQVVSESGNQSSGILAYRFV